MRKLINYKELSPSDIAFVDCGYSCILDLIRGSLTNQRLLLSKEEWSHLKTMFKKPAIKETLIQSRPSLRKIGQVFKNHRDTEECYWNAKRYQRKASAKNEKMGYELVGIVLDKMMKHGAIFSLTHPKPSEADIMIKIWADIFEVLFYNTGIYIRWGEKGLTTGETDCIMFKLDAKLVLIYNNNEYPVSCMEFAPYSGPKKIKTDRSKLLVEAKTLYNLTMGLNKNKENESLNIVNVQIMGLEGHILSVKLVDDYLYVAESIQSFTLPSTVSELKNNSKATIKYFCDFKQHVLDTANVVKQTLIDEEKIKKA